MKYLKRQEGMTTPIVIGLAVIVALAIGVAVWQAQKAKTNQATTSPTPTPTQSAQVSSTPTATPTPANEVKVTELGFKMTLPIGLDDLKYTAQTNLPGSAQHPGTYSTSSFITQSLVQADSRCSTANVGSIARYEQDPSSFMGSASTKKVGSFYLVFVTPSAPCSDKAAAEQLETSQTTLLRQAFDSAVAL